MLLYPVIRYINPETKRKRALLRFEWDTNQKIAKAITIVVLKEMKKLGIPAGVDSSGGNFERNNGMKNIL